MRNGQYWEAYSGLYGKDPMKDEVIELTLPYPPSVNQYWKNTVQWRNGRIVNKTYVNEKVKRYRDEVAKHILLHRCRKFLEYDITLELSLYPPDRRRRDIDNVLKALLDALEHGGLFLNDNQVCKLSIERHEVKSAGEILVKVLPYQR